MDLVEQLTAEQCKSLLVQAICSILMKCKNDKYRIVILPQEDIVPSAVVPDIAVTETQNNETTQVPAPAPAESNQMEIDANVCKKKRVFFITKFSFPIKYNLICYLRQHLIKVPPTGSRTNFTNVYPFTQ